MMDNKNVDLSVIKEKIIKTDEVIKILHAKKQENQKNQAKYQVLLNLYAKRCKDDKLIQEKVKLLEKTIENHQSFTKKYRALKADYEELEKTHGKYANDIQIKYQNASKQIEQLRAELDSKLLLQEESSKTCNAKVIKYENKISRLEEKQKTQNDLIKFLGKENKTLIRKLKIAEQEQPIEKYRVQAENYEKLTSFIRERLHSEKTSYSDDDVHDLINNHVDELNLYKDKFLQSEKNYSILSLEKKLLQDEIQYLRQKLEQTEFQKNNLKFCDQSVQTEDFNEHSVVENNLDFSNEHEILIDSFHKSFEFQSSDTSLDDEDASSVESIGYIFRDHALLKPISPFSISSEFEDNSTQYLEENILQCINPINIPAIEIIPPTPPPENLQEFEKIFDIEKSATEIKSRVCKRCNIYKKKSLNEQKVLLLSKNKIRKLRKHNMKLKNLLKSYRRCYKLSQLNGIRIRNTSFNTCHSPIKPENGNNSAIKQKTIYFKEICKGYMCKPYYFCYNNTRPTSPELIGFEEVKEHTEMYFECKSTTSKLVELEGFDEPKKLDCIEIDRSISPDFLGFEKVTNEGVHIENITIATEQNDKDFVVLNKKNEVEKSVISENILTNSTGIQINENYGDFNVDKTEKNISKEGRVELVTNNSNEKEISKEDAYSMIFKVFEKMVDYIDKKIDMCTNLSNNIENQNKIISPNEEQTFNQLLSQYNEKNTKRIERSLSSSSESLSSVIIKKQRRCAKIEKNIDKKRGYARKSSKQNLDSMEMNQTGLNNKNLEQFGHNSENSESDNCYDSELTSVDSGYTSENRTTLHSPIFKVFGNTSQNTVFNSINNTSNSNIEDTKEKTKKSNPVSKKNISKIKILRQKLSNVQFGRNKIKTSSNSHNIGTVIEGDKKTISNRELVKVQPTSESLNETTACSLNIGRKRRRIPLKSKCCNEEEEPPIKTTRLEDNKKHIEKNNIVEDIFTKRNEAAKILRSSVKLSPVKNEKSEKTAYKRPLCGSKFISCPLSPSPEDKGNEIDQNATNPKIIPLEKPQKLTKEAANEILNKLINFPNETHILKQAVNKLCEQDDLYIAEVILRKLREDVHDKPDRKYTPPAPLLTPIQRTLLGLMMALEKTNVKVCEMFLRKAEAKLLVEKNLVQISPVLRMYLTICKLRCDKERMRRLCCDAVYFMGDLAVPFLFIVLTSWAEIIPLASESENMPMVKTLLKVLMSKNCNKPGYNFTNLKNLLIQYYEYKELDSDDKVFEDLFNKYKEAPSWSLQYEILLLCKYCQKSWVMMKLKNTVIPFISAVTQAKFLMAIFSLVQKICQLFTEDCDAEYAKKIKDWISSLQKGIPATSFAKN